MDPPFWVLQADLPAAAGRTCWVSDERVVGIGPGWVDVRTGDLRSIRIHWLHDGIQASDYVSARGAIRADGALDAEALRVIHGRGWKRAAIYAVSAVALGLLAFLFFMEFRLREPTNPLVPR